MSYPEITIYDFLTKEVVVREMTQEEYEVLLADGWTPEASTEE